MCRCEFPFLPSLPSVDGKQNYFCISINTKATRKQTQMIEEEKNTELLCRLAIYFQMKFTPRVPYQWNVQYLAYSFTAWNAAHTERNWYFIRNKSCKMCTFVATFNWNCLSLDFSCAVVEPLVGMEGGGGGGIMASGLGDVKGKQWTRKRVGVNNVATERVDIWVHCAA